MNRLDEDMHPLFTKAIVEALHQRKIHTVLDFLECDTQQIVNVTRITFQDALAVKNSLLDRFGAKPLNGYDYYKNTLANSAIIPSGIESVDNLLDGGFFTGNIYEICGLAASGKTNFLLHLMKNVAHNMKQKVFIFDTKNDFTGLKIKSVLGEENVKNEMETLKRILIKKAPTRFDLINGLYEVKNDLEKDVLKLRLIIIDSLPAVLLDSNDPTKNNIFINKLSDVMRYIANENHVVFVITNLVRTWNDGNFKNPTREIIGSGKYWFGIPNVRLKINKENLNKCKLVLLSSDISDDKIGSHVYIEL